MAGLSPTLREIARAAFARATDAGESVEDAAFPASPTASLTRMQSADDGMGGSITTPTTYATGVHVRVETSGGDSVSQVGATPASPSIVIPWILTFPLGTDIDETTQITLSDGRAFEVVAILGPSSHSPSLRIGAKEIR